MSLESNVVTSKGTPLPASGRGTNGVSTSTHQALGAIARFFGLVTLLAGTAAAAQPETGHKTPAVATEVAATEVATTDPAVKDAFAAARELGTVDAWNAFLAAYPKGFYADLARAYLKKLGAAAPPAAPPPTTAAPAAPAPAAPPAAAPVTAPPAPPAEPPPQTAQPAPAPPPEQGAAAPQDGLPPTDPAKPAIGRGASYMGFPEQFNRYYTDGSWAPTKLLYVSPDGGGDGTTQQTPTTPAAAIAAAGPGTGIYFLRGAYKGGIELDKAKSGTYDAPIILYAERNADNTIGVKVDCNVGERKTCINLEAADDVAIIGFELVGGSYGVRAVGSGYGANAHGRGIVVLDCYGHDQERDPFFSGHVDWAVWERNVASGAKAGDGHGIYLSNGGDWNIVRFNETFGNASSDFQVNADPNATCKGEGIPFADPRCDAYAGSGDGGQGASDYFLVDSNYFHHGKGPGANFTSVRRSVIRNNIFGPQARHGVSFWQETDNPKLGASDNKIVHNLFVTTGRPALQFNTNSTRNFVANNVFVGVQTTKTDKTAVPVLVEVDTTGGDNVFRSNAYLAGQLEGRAPNPDEIVVASFSPRWFKAFLVPPNHDPNAFTPTATAPFLKKGALLPDAPTDRNGAPRPDKPDLGPINGP